LVQLRRQSDLRHLRGALHWEGDLSSMRHDAS
jgi:hypothetical protein